MELNKTYRRSRLSIEEIQRWYNNDPIQFDEDYGWLHLVTYTPVRYIDNIAVCRLNVLPELSYILEDPLLYDPEEFEDIFEGTYEDWFVSQDEFNDFERYISVKMIFPDE